MNWSRRMNCIIQDFSNSSLLMELKSRILVLWITVFRFQISSSFILKDLTKEITFFWILVVFIIPKRLKKLSRLLICVKMLMSLSLRMRSVQMFKNVLKMLNLKLLKVTKMDFWLVKDKIHLSLKDSNQHWLMEMMLSDPILVLLKTL